jgi:hypothetical protein
MPSVATLILFTQAYTMTLSKYVVCVLCMCAHSGRSLCLHALVFYLRSDWTDFNKKKNNWYWRPRIKNIGRTALVRTPPMRALCCVRPRGFWEEKYTEKYKENPTARRFQNQSETKITESSTYVFHTQISWHVLSMNIIQWTDSPLARSPA